MTVNPDRLHQVMGHVAAQMRASFLQSGLVPHSTSKGSLREERVQIFLADFLPRVAEVTGSAHLVSADGQSSGQCDVLVVDATTPRLGDSDTVRLVPIECCHASVEVKSSVDSSVLGEVWAAASRLKSLPRTAYLPLWGLWAISGDNGAPISARPQVHLFAYSGVSLDTLRDAMVTLSQGEPDAAMGLDSVCVLDQGFITWADPADGSWGDRAPGRHPAICRAEPGDVLLFLVSFLHTQLANAEIRPRVDLRKYVTKALGDGTLQF